MLLNSFNKGLLLWELPRKTPLVIAAETTQIACIPLMRSNNLKLPAQFMRLLADDGLKSFH